MHLSSCQSPKRIVNPYTKVIQYVPCGKCTSCLNTRNSIWVTRITQEIMCWKYTAFITLTYDDSHVNLVSFDRDTNSLVDFQSGLVVSLDDVDSASLKYIRTRGSFGYLVPRDVQLFVKRFRSYTKNLLDSYSFNGNTKQKYSSTIRYFACGEYGPTTYRPHYHLLFFFNEDVTAQNFSSLLHKSWKFGLVDFSFASSGAASYVAQYLNSNYLLPKIYSHKYFKPFSLCSKCPPIGTLSFDDSEIFKIFDRGLVKRDIFKKHSVSYVSTPLWRCTEDRLFPKISGFSDLSHSDRVAVYGCVKFYGSQTEFELKEAIKSDCIEKAEILGCAALDGAPSYDGLIPNELPRLWYYLYSLYLDSYEHPSVMTRLFSISRRVLLQCELFDCTLDYYVSRIENYYDNKNKELLKMQLEFEQDFSAVFGCQSLIYLDLAFVHRVLQHYYAVTFFESSMPKNTLNNPCACVDRLILESFNINPDRFICDSDYRESLDLFRHSEYKSMCEKHDLIFKKSSKTKRKNDYLELHPEYRLF